MRRIVLDLDPWIFCVDRSQSTETLELFREHLASYRELGFEVVVFSSCGMIGVDGELLEAITGVPSEILQFLSPTKGIWDEIVFGKPPTGSMGLVIDDKAVTPEEFLTHDYEQIKRLISEG
jgi:capsule biosynthesis phosphatase